MGAAPAAVAVAAMVVGAHAGNTQAVIKGHQIRCCADLAELNRIAAEAIIQVVTTAIELRGYCQLALTGGNTPRQLYQLLASPSYAQRIPWSRLHCYFGDERAVPQNHPDSNYQMAYTTMLSKVAIPSTQIFPMILDPAHPEREAEHYAKLLDAKLPKARGIPSFDLILLGMGADGHTASLFPDSSLVREQQRTVAASFIEKLNAWRVSLTFPVLNAAQQIMILVSGADKATTLQKVMYEPTAGLPIQQLTIRDAVVWFIDNAAATRLEQV